MKATPEKLLTAAMLVVALLGTGKAGAQLISETCLDQL